MTSRWPLDLAIDPGRSQITHDAQAPLDPAVWEAGVPVALLAPPARSGAEIDGLFLPEGYEPTYAYPLLVWLSTVPVSPCEFERRMQAISERNYLGVCIPVSPQAEVADVALQVQNVVCAVRRDYHVHSERIILAATADGAALALEVALRHPAWFGGVVSLGAPPTARCLLAEAGQLRGFRAFLGGTTGSDWPALKQTERLLWTAGLNVRLWQWTEGSRIPANLWRELNHWLMAGIENEATVWA
jgi:phospholipase/carboxylesterase